MANGFEWYVDRNGAKVYTSLPSSETIIGSRNARSQNSNPSRASGTQRSAARLPTSPPPRRVREAVESTRNGSTAQARSRQTNPTSRSSTTAQPVPTQRNRQTATTRQQPTQQPKRPRRPRVTVDKYGNEEYHESGDDDEYYDYGYAVREKETTRHPLGKRPRVTYDKYGEEEYHESGDDDEYYDYGYAVYASSGDEQQHESADDEEYDDYDDDLPSSPPPLRVQKQLASMRNVNDMVAKLQTHNPLYNRKANTSDPRLINTPAIPNPVQYDPANPYAMFQTATRRNGKPAKRARGDDKYGHLPTSPPPLRVQRAVEAMRKGSTVQAHRQAGRPVPNTPQRQPTQRVVQPATQPYRAILSQVPSNVDALNTISASGSNLPLNRTAARVAASPANGERAAAKRMRVAPANERPATSGSVQRK